MTWNKKDIDPELVRGIAGRFNMDLLAASVALRRGLSGCNDLCYFLEDDLRYLHNPFLFVDMEDAIDRIHLAREEGEKLLVVGDRDVDGITSTALLFKALKDFGIDVACSLPLGDDDYGLSFRTVTDFASNSGTLIITVDCGISNRAEVAYAAEKGIDTIIIDHHNPQAELPPAFAILNPKLEASGYPFRDLAGCGVVFKFIWALRFSETELYNHPIYLLNVRPGNEIIILEAVKMINLTVVDRISENLVPGMVKLEQTRLNDFLTGHELFVYEAEIQKKMLKSVFGPKVDIHLMDLAPEIWKVFPPLVKKSLLAIRELSKMAKYRDKAIEELEVFINLFVSFIHKSEERISRDFQSTLDLVALGTIADLMPLINENRILVKQGLAALNDTSREGLKTLIVKQGLAGKKIDAADIAWHISPLINSTGRMGVPDKALRLLLSEDRDECEHLAGAIIELNKERKKLGDSVWNMILPAAQKSYDEMSGKAVLVADQKIHRGITGIIASRLNNYFNATSIVVALLEDKAVGSVRGVNGFNVRQLLDYCSKLFTDYGGHDFAAGFNMPNGNYPEFKQRLKSFVNLSEAVKPSEGIIEIDAEIPPDFMTPELIRLVDLFEPYGEGNPSLVFLIKSARITEIELIGKQERTHVRLLLDIGKYKWPSVFWNASDRVGKDFALNDKVDLVFRLGRNYFQNTENLQLTILDIHR
ncbi:MAG: single-stranded-DNA-specific exonuclease RecJ [Spirochaetota bacterium]